MIKLAAGFSAIAFLLSAVPAHAQLTRTWVSGVGDDAFPCTRTDPCKTFAGALSRTAAGGEISTLDPGGFGPVTITKSISITNDNSGEAGIVAAGVTGVTVSGAGITVRLRGLIIDGGASGGQQGVRFSAGAALHIQNCVIRNFTMAGPTTGNGVTFTPGASAKLMITDTRINSNGAGASGAGVFIKPTGGAFASVTLTRVTMDDNSNGLVIDTTFGGGVLATVADSSASNNNNTGVALIGNNAGLSVSTGGKIVSYLNNVVRGNTTAGAPTSTSTGE
jgi:hypothetical protein